MSREYATLTWTNVGESVSHTINCADIYSLYVEQSCDMSGCTAPYAIATAVVYGTGLDSMIGIHATLTIVTNVKTIGTYYVQSVERKSPYAYEITAISALGVLAEEWYDGIRFFNNVIYGTTTAADVGTVFNMITGTEFTIDTSLLVGSAYRYSDGIIAEGYKRDAVRLLAQAHGCIIDPYLNLKNIAQSNVTPLVIPTSRVYVNTPKITASEAISQVTINHYYAASASSTTETVRAMGENHTINKYTPSVYTRTVNGTKTTEIFNHALSMLQPEPTLLPGYKIFDHAIVGALWENRTWEGKVIWNTATDECKLGTRVTVPCSDGTTATGSVIQSNLNFSGASVASVMKVALENT